MRNFYLDVAPDGSGTKPIITAEAFSISAAARDLMAMVMGDITRFGGLTVIVSNVLDVATLGKAGSSARLAFEEAILGMRKAALEQRVVLWRGETAEMGVCVGSENPDAEVRFTWAGFALGVYPERPITGEEMEPGDIVVALREEGFRSNGISSVRAAFRKTFGKKWWNKPSAKSFITAAAAPSVLYDRFLAEINGWYDESFKHRIRLCAIVHVSGGGIPSKFGKDILFPMGLSAELTELYDPPIIMGQCGVIRGMGSRDFYNIWNGGQGMLVVMRAPYVHDFLRYARQSGVGAKPCGRILRRPSPSLIIHSKYRPGVVEYTP